MNLYSVGRILDKLGYTSTIDDWRIELSLVFRVGDVDCEITRDGKLHCSDGDIRSVCDITEDTLQERITEQVGLIRQKREKVTV